MKTIEAIVHEIFELYDRFGSENYSGEEVSQLEHMSQAAQLAMKDGFDDEVVLAAFFHDIGHICVKLNSANSMGGYGVINHEKAGADFLHDMGFPERVVSLVGNHVKAKRYLTYKYPSYYASLSNASRKTLEYQGGRMSVNEADEFEHDPLFSESIALRKWDELAKEKAVPVIEIEKLKQIAVRVLRGRMLS
jgi:2-amino-1-hydroxyethylphosphonate dioxygenase (glycine-forming)